jgi:hypothetical protein
MTAATINIRLKRRIKNSPRSYPCLLFESFISLFERRHRQTQIAIFHFCRQPVTAEIIETGLEQAPVVVLVYFFLI